MSLREDVTCIGQSVTLMSPLIPSGWNMVWIAPVLKDNMAFLSCEQTQTSDDHHHHLLFSIMIRLTSFIRVGKTDLENTFIVQIFQGERVTLRQHSVKPALQDGGDAEPVQRELHTTINVFTIRAAVIDSHPAKTHCSTTVVVTLKLTAAWPLTWKMMSSASSNFFCSATMSSLRRSSFQAHMVSSPYWSSSGFFSSPGGNETSGSGYSVVSGFMSLNDSKRVRLPMMSSRVASALNFMA